MSTRNFRKNGLLIKEAPNGDILITDNGKWTGAKMSMVINWRQATEQSDEECARMFNRLINFFERHRELRS